MTGIRTKSTKHRIQTQQEIRPVTKHLASTGKSKKAGCTSKIERDEAWPRSWSKPMERQCYYPSVWKPHQQLVLLLPWPVTRPLILTLSYSFIADAKTLIVRGICTTTAVIIRYSPQQQQGDDLSLLHSHSLRLFSSTHTAQTAVTHLPFDP